MESKGNIMNRGVKSNIRDKNFTFQSQEEVKDITHGSYKEKKMNEISEHRRMALLGNRQERVALTQKFQEQTKHLNQARQQTI